METIILFLLFCVYTTCMVVLVLNTSNPTRNEFHFKGPVKFNVKLENNKMLDSQNMLEATEEVLDAEYIELQDISKFQIDRAIKSYSDAASLVDTQRQKKWSRYI